MRAQADRTSLKCLANISTWTTTLQSIVPLPCNIETLPSEDYPVGTHVLAVYPDTSCFYMATIQGGGPNMSSSISRSKVRK